jgi:hypothetical protein
MLTIGRVLVFHQGTAGIFPGSDAPRAAIVAQVHGPKCVNLCVIDANGNTHARTSVPFVAEGETPPACGFYCEWPTQSTPKERMLGQARIG